MAYINQTFDSSTMALPTASMIKEGKLTSVTDFDKVFMRFGSNNITINITALTHQNYSIFYFVTVDNSALNAKSTQVYF